MGIGDSLKDFYYKLQDGYYGFLDALEGKGLPVYKAVDALESNNIPSFPVAILFVLLLLSGIVFMALPLLAPTTGTIKFSVADSEAALNGASVSIVVEGEEQSAFTNARGEAEFKVAVGKTATYTVSMDGYSDKTGSKLVSACDSFGCIAVEKIEVELSEEAATVKKTVQFMDKAGIEAFTEPLTATFSCSDNTDYENTKNVNNGSVDLELPSDCGNLIIDVAGEYGATDPSVDIGSGEVIEISLSAKETGSGSAVVYVNSEEPAPVAGIEVYLVQKSEAGGTLKSFGPKETTSTGSASFDGLTAGIYCFTTYDSQGTYAEYDSCNKSDGKKEVLSEKRTDFTIQLSKRNVGKINVVVKKKSSMAPVDGASVALSKDGAIIKSEETGEDGKASFNVGENVPYDLSIDAEGFLLESIKGITPKEDYYEALLSEATRENTRSLKARIVDELGAPIEDARVRLYNLDEVQVGDELLTGFDGISIFGRIEEGTYKVYASKPGYDEAYSAEITVSARTENSVEIKLDIGRGSVEVTVYDDKEQPLPGANVKLVDFYYGAELSSKNTNKDGAAAFTARADKTVYAVVSNQGSSSYVTIPRKIEKDITQRLSAALEKSVSKFDIVEKGIYVDGEALQAPYNLNPGQGYKIKFLLYLPEGSSFDETGIHVRAGSDEITTTERDDIYIKDFVGAYSSLRKGATYNPPLGYAKDLKNLTRGDAKWINAVTAKPIAGVYEAEAEVMVKDSAKQQGSLEIHYRGYAKVGGYRRSPIDAELGLSESSATRQGLYANTKAIIASVGPSSLCTDEFCSSFRIEDLDTKTRTFVIDEYPAQAMGHYRLLLGGITKQSDGIIANAKLRISDSTKGIVFGNYALRTAIGLKASGKADSTKFELDLGGEISKGTGIGGEVDGGPSYIDFTPSKEGASKLSIAIVSGEGETVFEKIITVKIASARELAIEIVPKTIVPYIENNLLIRVTGSGGIENALITIAKDGTTIATEKTDAEGILAYKISAPAPGLVYTITAEKAGFTGKKIELKVSENILETTPSRIDAVFIIGKGHEIESEFFARNTTLIPLTILGIEESAELSDYISVSYDDGIVGKLLDVNKDMNITLILTLKEKALQIEKPKNLEGSLTLKVGNKDLGKEWLSRVGLTARIGFGDEVDKIDCLTATPPKWEILASDEAKKQAITITNNCTVDDEPIVLSALEARLIGADAQTGKLEATAAEGGIGKVELSSAPKKIMNSLKEGTENTVNLDFTPMVSSGAEKLELEFTAIHHTSKATERIKAKIVLNIAVSKLAECIEVKPATMNITSCSGTTGFGLYGNNRFNGFNPYNPTGGSGDYTPGYSSYGRNYQFGFPNQNYYPPGMDGTSMGGWGNGQGAMDWGCSGGRIDVINNCASEIDFDLDADEGLHLDDTKFTVKPNETKEVGVQAGYAIGIYKVIVNAKPKASHDKYVKVQEVKVNVESEALKTYRDCISISPSSTLRFNGFLGTGVYLDIRNKCYNEGIRLKEDNSGIEFLDTAQNPTAPTIPPQFLEGYPRDGGVESPSRLIQNHAYVGTPIWETTSDGKVIQVARHKIVKSVKYIQDAPKFPEGTETPFMAIGGLRYFMTAGYYAIEADTMLKVSFTTRTGSQTSITFPIRIEDMWQAGPYLDRLVKYGDPKLKPEGCAITSALDLTDEYPEPECIPYEELGKTFERKVIKLAERDDKGNEINGCGWGDGITSLSKKTIEKNGIKVILAVSEDRHSVNVKVTGWEGRKNIPPTTIDEIIRVGIKRQYYNIEEKTVPLRVRLCIKGKSDEEPGTEVAQACENGATGEDTYKKYGFDKLLFNWDWDSKELGDNACTEKFCDAAQLGIALNKKAEKINTVVLAVIKNYSENCAASNLEDCKMSNEKAKFTNTKDLFRWAVGSFRVKDNVDNKELVFFEDNESGKLVVEDSKAIGEIKKDIGSKLVNSTDWLTIVDSQSKLDKINALRDYKDSVLLLFDTSIKDEKLKVNGNDRSAITVLGMDAAKIKETDYYAMTFSEYYALHKAINEKGESAANAAEVTGLTILGNANVTITASFLNKLNMARKEVAVGVLAKDNMTEDAKNTAMKNGNIRAGIDISSEASFLDFYNKNIEFEALLVKDGYSEDYKKDFAAGYEDKPAKIGTVEFANWKFMEKDSKGKDMGEEGAVLSDAGKFKVLVNYDWGTGKESANIEFTLLEKLSKVGGKEDNDYSSNALFYMPFDGKLGYLEEAKEEAGAAADNKQTGDRIGYGTAYTGGAALKGMFYVNSSKDNDSALTLQELTGNKDNAVAASFDNRKDIANTGNAKILEIGEKKIDFAPSDPIFVEAKITKAKKGAYPVGIIYSLTAAGNVYVGEANKPNSIAVNNNIFNWTIISDRVSEKSGAIKDYPERTASLCPGKGEDKMIGIMFNGDNKGDIKLSSVIYVPTAIEKLDTAKTKTSSLTVTCAKDSMAMTAKDYVNDAGKKTSLTTAGTLSLNNGKTGRERVRTDYSLEGLIGKINAGEVCVATDKDSAAFYWNPAKISGKKDE